MKLLFFIMLLTLLTVVNIVPQQKQTVDFIDLFKGSSGSGWVLPPCPTFVFTMFRIIPGSKAQIPGAGYEFIFRGFGEFSHTTESANQGYISVDLAEFDIKAELNGTTRASYLNSYSAALFLNLKRFGENYGQTQ